jgi:hypothetical protein
MPPSPRDRSATASASVTKPRVERDDPGRGGSKTGESMARVEIYIEDEGPGVNYRVRFIGDFSIESLAHRMAIHIDEFLNSKMEWKSDEKHEVIRPPDEIVTTQRPGLITHV